MRELLLKIWSFCSVIGCLRTAACGRAQQQRLWNNRVFFLYSFNSIFKSVSRHTEVTATAPPQSLFRQNAVWLEIRRQRSIVTYELRPRLPPRRLVITFSVLAWLPLATNMSAGTVKNTAQLGFKNSCISSAFLVILASLGALTQQVFAFTQSHTRSCNGKRHQR